MFSNFISGFVLFVKIALHISKDIETRLGHINPQIISMSMLTATSYERLNKSCGRV